MKKLFAILVLLILATSAFGGYYYYSQIYRPEQYKKAVLPLYEKIGLQMAIPSLPEIQDSADFLLVLNALEQSEMNLEKVKKDFVLLKPPKKLKDFHRNFSEGLELALSAIDESKTRTNFWLKADDFLKEMEKTRTTLEETTRMTKQIRTVKDLRGFWRPPLQEVKSLANEMFTQETAALEDATFKEIQSLWKETEGGIDYILSLLNSLPSALPLEQISSVLSQEQNQESEESFRKIEKLIDFLEPKIRKGGAYNISGFNDFSKQAELSELSFKIYQQIEDFKKKR